VDNNDVNLLMHHGDRVAAATTIGRRYIDPERPDPYGVEEAVEVVRSLYDLDGNEQDQVHAALTEHLNPFRAEHAASRAWWEGLTRSKKLDFLIASGNEDLISRVDTMGPP
jgi:hypothetical protein